MFDLSINFIKKIKRNLFPFYRDKKLKFVFKTLHESFAKDIVVARFVGGCVRKYLTNEIIDDIDIATTLSTNEIKEKFKNTNFKIIDTGIKHGTVTLVSGRLKLELTTLRKDVQTDGRHAKVEDLETNKKISYRLVGQDEADIKKNLVFFRSPIGKAFIGKDKGEMVTVNTPSGERNFEILDVEYI